MGRGAQRLGTRKLNPTAEVVGLVRQNRQGWIHITREADYGVAKASKPNPSLARGEADAYVETLCGERQHYGRTVKDTAIGDVEFFNKKFFRLCPTCFRGTGW